MRTNSQTQNTGPNRTNYVPDGRRGMAAGSEQRRSRTRRATASICGNIKRLSFMFSLLLFRVNDDSGR